MAYSHPLCDAAVITIGNRTTDITGSCVRRSPTAAAACIVGAARATTLDLRLGEVPDGGQRRSCEQFGYWSLEYIAHMERLKEKPGTRVEIAFARHVCNRIPRDASKFAALEPRADSVIDRNLQARPSLTVETPEEREKPIGILRLDLVSMGGPARRRTPRRNE